MSTHTTVDHDEIRRWVEEHGGSPAVLRGTEADDGSAIPAIKFGQSNIDFIDIDWDNFFDYFESQGLAFHYSDEVIDGQEESAYNFIARDSNSNPSVANNPTELPEDNEIAEENIFSSSEPFNAYEDPAQA